MKATETGMVGEAVGRAKATDFLVRTQEGKSERLGIGRREGLVA
jgi:hypothetical protein